MIADAASLLALAHQGTVRLPGLAGSIRTSKDTCSPSSSLESVRSWPFLPVPTPPDRSQVVPALQTKACMEWKTKARSFGTLKKEIICNFRIFVWEKKVCSYQQDLIENKNAVKCNG